MQRGRPEQAVAPGSGPVASLAACLRELRISAGLPSYRELAGRANYSASALSEAARGRRLPSLDVTLAFVRACDGDVDGWTERWYECAAQLAALERTASAGAPVDAWRGVRIDRRHEAIDDSRWMPATLTAVGLVSVVNLFGIVALLRRLR